MTQLIRKRNLLYDKSNCQIAYHKDVVCTIRGNNVRHSRDLGNIWISAIWNELLQAPPELSRFGRRFCVYYFT